MKIIIENKEILQEDKVVKFNGEMYPKFGWAVIFMGGGGSGKGSAFKKLIPVEGKYMNIDDLKENPKFWDIENRDSGMSYKQAINARLQDKTKGEVSVDDIIEPAKGSTIGIGSKNKGYRDTIQSLLTNAEYNNEVHQALKPLGKKIKQNARDTGRDANVERLPNVIFDIVADELEDIQVIIDALKPRGYKIAIVWVLSTASKALYNNKTRGRAVPEEVLLRAHAKVINTARELFNSSYINDVDNFWVINTFTPKEIFSDDLKYHDYQNVFQIPTTPNGLENFINIFKQTNKLWNQSWKTGKKTKEFEPAKPFNLNRRMNQQTTYLNKKLNDK